MRLNKTEAKAMEKTVGYKGAAQRMYEGDLKGSEIDRHRPRPETMKAFLEQVEARYGGVTRWLADHGFGEADLERLRARLVTGPGATTGDS